MQDEQVDKYKYLKEIGKRARDFRPLIVAKEMRNDNETIETFRSKYACAKHYGISPALVYKYRLSGKTLKREGLVVSFPIY